MSKADASLLEGGHFEYSDRPVRDRWWAAAYLCFLIATVAAGIYGLKHSNPDFKLSYEQGYMDSTDHCPLGADGGRRLSSVGEGDAPDFDLGAFFDLAWKTLLGSAAASFVLGLFMLQLFQHRAGLMIKLAVPLQILLPSAAAVWFFVEGVMYAGFVFLFQAAIVALCFFLWRKWFDLGARLLSTSAAGLNGSPGLLLFAVIQQLAFLLLLLPLMGLLGASVSNGHVAPNPERGNFGLCMDDSGREVACCVWQVDKWVRWYLIIGGLTMLWTVLLAFSVRCYVVSGSIAQWWQGVGGGSSRSATLRCVGHALGSNFGSLCFASAVLSLVEMLRFAATRGPRLVRVCVGLLMRYLAALIEFLTTFAIVRAAITGEDFLDAARSATDLLKRNGLKSLGVWWFPPVVLRGWCLGIAVAWGVVVGIVSHVYWAHLGQSVAGSVWLGVLAGWLVLLVLTFFASVLLNCIDAVYLCYAMDLDAATCTRPEVAAVFQQLPVHVQTGAAVTQPGGEIVYGAAPPQSIPLADV